MTSLRQLTTSRRYCRRVPACCTPSGCCVHTARRPRRCTTYSVLQRSRGSSMRHHAAWSGMCSAADRARLDSLLRRAKRLGYCSDDVPAIEELFNSADDDFFHRVKTNTNHVLQPHLPDNTDLPYQLRTRSHNMTLINKAKFLTSDDFFYQNAVQIFILSPCYIH